MTPPSSKPVPGSIEDPQTSETETNAPDEGQATPDEGATSEGMAAESATNEGVGGDGQGRATTGRRRAASLELRVANRRSAISAVEEGEAPARTTKGTGRASRAQASGGLRMGPKAQQRAAKAALADATNDSADDDNPTSNDAASPDPQAISIPVSADFSDPAAYETTASDSVADEPAPVAPAAQEPVALRIDPPQPVSPPPQARTSVPIAEPAKPVDDRQIEILSDDDGPEDERAPGGGGRRRMTLKAEKRAARASKNNDAAHYVVAPTVSMAEMRPRHYGVIALFILMTIIPTISYSTYLWTRAVNQYESNVGFGSRTEEAPATFDVLGALAGSSQNGSKDMDIVYQFIVSQELVSKIDKSLDLKAMYHKAEGDPLNSFRKGGTIEDLLDYWKRMVKVNYDTGTGLMSLEVFAFDPKDAQMIAQMILVESTQIINQLSLTAQVDTTRYSKEALEAAEEKLAAARLAVLDYQIKNGIVDPTNAISNQNGIVGNLNSQLAAAQVELDMLTGTVGKNDVRIATLNRRIEVIQNRIAAEQSKVGGLAGEGTPGFATLMQEFERLRVDQSFAENAYLAARGAYDQALTDAQHKTRYLATYVAPTLAEAPTAPDRPFTAMMVAIVGFLLWSITVLIYYALRDRR